MTIRKLTAITAAIFLVTILKVEARTSELYEARDFYTFQVHKYQQKRISRAVSKPKKIITYKEKSAKPIQVASLGKEPLGEAPTVSGLIETAKKYLGTNPTGWRSLWCGRFMAMVAPVAAKKIGNANLAINWAKLPKVAPRIGAILITRRYGGSGHVGIVIGFKNGNPITISGNHGHKVGIGTYHKSRIIAYVSA